jgi:hypothetical protein
MDNILYYKDSSPYKLISFLVDYYNFLDELLT